MTPEMDAVLAAIMGGSWTVDTIAEASHMAPILVLRAAVRLRKQGLIDRMPGQERLRLLPKFSAGR